ncbi:hypothetical protein DFH09DRAFT_1081439 [Mycena vulgaris]|nr:hypothetical protein DFH09DRAFT_1081439 [Mycena vulgaris]
MSVEVFIRSRHRPSSLRGDLSSDREGGAAAEEIGGGRKDLNEVDLTGGTTRGGAGVGVTQALNVENDGATGRWRRVVEWRADEEVLNRGSADGIKARSLNCGIPMDLWRVNTDRGARTAPRERREGSRRGRSGRSGKPDPPKLGHPEIHCSAQLSKRDRRDGGEEYIKQYFVREEKACNQEKVQSMLCRLREAQAAELGLATRADTRRAWRARARACTRANAGAGSGSARSAAGREDLRRCGLSLPPLIPGPRADKETAGLMTMKCLREKRHWEMQIVAPGGANYRRNVAMRDDDGRDVRGTKGYKYFGRAKALPGPAEYFGNADEGDGAPRLSEYERKAEDEDAHRAPEAHPQVVDSCCRRRRRYALQIRRGKRRSSTLHSGGLPLFPLRGNAPPAPAADRARCGGRAAGAADGSALVEEYFGGEEGRGWVKCRACRGTAAH